MSDVPTNPTSPDAPNTSTPPPDPAPGTAPQEPAPQSEQTPASNPEPTPQVQPDPPPQEPPPEVKPDHRANRKYVGRAFGILWPDPKTGTVRIEGDFYSIGGMATNVEGRYDGRPFDTTDELASIASFGDQDKQTFLQRMTHFLKQPNRF